MSREPDLAQINCKLNALLAFAVMSLQAEDNGTRRKPEEVLAACGLKPDQIALILGKEENAVRVMLHRAGVRFRKKAHK